MKSWRDYVQLLANTFPELKPAAAGRGTTKGRPVSTDKPMIILAAPCGTTFGFKCDDVIDGVPINPEQPPNFDDTRNEDRSDRSRSWWGVPFVRTYHDTNPKFVEHWKGTTRFDVRCLDGGAWDRSTVWGMFGTLEEAIACAKTFKPAWV